jgi:RNA polymerase sigma-70 factor (ECF subfamily)
VRSSVFLDVSASYSADLDLARRAAAAEAAAWDEIVHRFGTTIYNLAYRFAGAGSDAEDLTQDVFLKLYANLGHYRGNVPLVAWALRLSRNLCIDRYRAWRARPLAFAEPEEALAHLASDDDPGEHARRHEQVHMVHEALRSLPEVLATVVMLRDFEELAYDEIAAFLEVPIGTVKSRLARGRRALVATIQTRLAGPSRATAQGASC